MLVTAGLGAPADHALISLLALNGLRVSEAIGADIEALGLVRGHRTLTIVRRGGKIVTAPLAPRTARAVDLAVGERYDGPIFLSGTGQRMDRHAAARIVRRVARRSGITKRVGPHTLRHAFITAALDAGVPLRDVQEAASHADPRTTMRYDRARVSLDRHATYIVATFIAGAARWRSPAASAYRSRPGNRCAWSARALPGGGQPARRARSQGGSAQMRWDLRPWFPTRRGRRLPRTRWSTGASLGDLDESENSTMSEKRVVFALFENEAAADAAVESLKAWDKLDDDVKIKGIGVLALDEDGKLKIHKVGPRRGIVKGAATGAVIVVLAGWIVSPLALPVALGAAGATRRGLKMTDERREELSTEIENGKAAVGVIVTVEESEAVFDKLLELGGSPEHVDLTPELEAAAAEVPETDAVAE